MAHAIGLAALGFVAALLFHAGPAAADIEVNAGCDGKWVTREVGDLGTHKVCERHPVGLRSRAHIYPAFVAKRRFAHLRPYRAAPSAVAHLRRRPEPNSGVVLAGLSAPRDVECLILSCPQFLLTGVGY